ncbi:unnamed protein product [Gemmata massiliana]|uniref:Uncharacterized protein n=1 Tax=Gemmata massiliana TaxID=1210884 RepID=A0A6P2D4N4_9BACT|nr:hypothetical protein [Gemmata massiliana]VTR96033.1 unnamed protein product [Gemmata massiliana]
MSDSIPSGIACPRCKGTDWKVEETRAYRNRLVRVRACKGCFLRVRTREVLEALNHGPKKPRTRQSCI